MSEEAREFTGLSATEAAINACEEFGVNRSGIEYEVISETGEGLDKQVVIKAKLKEVDLSNILMKRFHNIPVPA